MKSKILLLYIIAALMIISLSGCAEIRGNAGDNPGYGPGDDESAALSDNQGNEKKADSKGADNIDLSELKYYEWYENKQFFSPELNDSALDALATRFAGYDSVKVTGIRRVVNETGSAYNSYDIVADAERYTLDITSDNAISITPYEWDELSVKDGDQVRTIGSVRTLTNQLNKSGAEFTLNGHEWLVKGATGKILRDGIDWLPDILWEITDLCLTDVDGDGKDDIVLIAILSPNSDLNYSLIVFDTESTEPKMTAIAVTGSIRRERDRYGQIVHGKMRLAVGKDGNLLLDEYGMLGDHTCVYKICRDSSGAGLKFLLVNEFEEIVYPDDARITG